MVSPRAKTRKFEQRLEPSSTARIVLRRAAMNRLALAPFLVFALAPRLAHAQSAEQAQAPATPATSTATAPQQSAPSQQGQREAEEEAAKKKKDEQLRRVYVSISPFLLIFPIVEVTAEVRVHPRIGVAAMGGIGSIDPHKWGGLPKDIESSNWTVWELGAQGAGYVLGDFDGGLRLGAQIQYAGVSGNVQKGTVSGAGFGSGLGLGAFIGGKWTSSVGFALHGDIGVQTFLARAEATASNGTSTATATKTASDVGLLLHLNLGWAF